MQMNNRFGHLGMKFSDADSLTQLRDQLHRSGFLLAGVEIAQSAHSLTSLPEALSSAQQKRGLLTNDIRVAVVLGHETQGLTPQACLMCDFLLYIPQARAATASLNVSVAGALVFFEMFKLMSDCPNSEHKADSSVEMCGSKFIDPSLQHEEAENVEPVSESLAIEGLREFLGDCDDFDFTFG